MKRIFTIAIVLVGVVLAAVIYKQFQPTDKTPEQAHVNQKQSDHDDHAEKTDQDHNEEDGDRKVARLTEDEMKELGIEVRTAGPGRIKVHVSLPGEVTVNADRLGHVVPRVPGIVREVKKTLGEKVQTGEVMAVLESRELADAKSAYLAAKEREDLALANFRREKELWTKKITSEQEYLEAKQKLAEVRIELRSAEQKLHALGFSESFVKKLPSQPDVDFTYYEIRAPFDGTVIEKHITIGEVLHEETEAFVIADLDTVWVNLSIYQKDLPFVQIGQKAIISAGQGLPDAEGTISYLGPMVGEKTRTAPARVVLPNEDGRWKPGLFVNAQVVVSEMEAAVAVPKTALQTMEDQSSIFVRTEEGFEPRAVSVGRSNDVNIEILSGLEKGDRYVSKGAFTLKAEIGKEAFGEGDEH
ncbi:MAG: efflux RND transporter periplasmic adaptor subunit [bacterium]